MIKALRGMKDIIENGEIYRKIIGVCEEVATNFGHKFIETPKLEETALFRRSVGESSDIVNKEMYEFADKSGLSVCLRPEGTAGVVRAFIEAKFDKASQKARYFYHGSMFRYERPQKGRLREFHQFGVESFGIEDVREDANIILIGSEILRRLGIKSTLKINSLGDENCMPIYREKLVKFLLEREDCLCEDCKVRIKTNPIRVLDCKNEKCQEILQNAPLITQNLSPECEKEFEKLQQTLRENSVDFVIEPRLVRGLDYYTKTAFEFSSDALGSQSAVIGGGRYDRLVEFLGGRATAGVGFAMGVERVMEILSANENKSARKGVYICALDASNLDFIYNIGVRLRAHNLVQIGYEAKNLQKQLKTADNLECEICLCVGENEMARGEIWYKNLTTKAEKTLKIEEILGGKIL